MRFIPDYTVSYCGTFHRAKEPFDIDEKDADEMKKHGVVENTEELIDAQIPEEVEVLDDGIQEERPQRRPGRPRKQD